MLTCTELTTVYVYEYCSRSGASRADDSRAGAVQQAAESTAGSSATGGGSAGWPLLVYVVIGGLLLLLLIAVLLLALLLHRNQKRLRLLGSSAHGVYCNADLADEIEPGVFSSLRSRSITYLQSLAIASR